MIGVENEDQDVHLASASEYEILTFSFSNAKKLFSLYTWQQEKSKLIQFYQGFIENSMFESGR
jgi:hypothetical protein